MRRSRTRAGGHGDEDVPWASFADALTGLLFVFIVLALGFAYQLSQAEELAAERELEAQERLEQRARAQGIERDLITLDAASGGATHSVAACLNDASGSFELGLELRPTPKESRLSIYLHDKEKKATIGWFEELRPDLREAQCKVAQALGSCLEQALEHEDLDPASHGDHFKLQVFVEGHTDYEPIVSGSAFPTNWELSSARAAAVVRAFLLTQSDTGRDLPCQAPAPPVKLQAAMAAQRLDVIAIGRAARSPAWGSICSEDPQERVCACMNQEGATLDTCAQEIQSVVGWQRLRAQAQRDCDAAPSSRMPAKATATSCACVELWGAALEDCVEPSATATTADAPAGAAPPLTDLFVQWANATEDRRELQRRVDLRFEVVPGPEGRLAAQEDRDE